MILHRINKLGEDYELRTDDFGKKTLITWNKKSIVVNIPIDEISQCWYDWQMKGMLIQNAFPSFTDDEREFILTGYTTHEWNEIFKEEREK